MVVSVSRRQWGKKDQGASRACGINVRLDLPCSPPLLSCKRLVVHIRGQVVRQCILRVNQECKAPTSEIRGTGGVPFRDRWCNSRVRDRVLGVHGGEETNV